jgi:hypothetical protein
MDAAVMGFEDAPDIVVGWYPRNPETGRALTSQPLCLGHFLREGDEPDEKNSLGITATDAREKDIRCIGCEADVEALGGDPRLARLVPIEPVWQGDTPLMTMPKDTPQ